MRRLILTALVLTGTASVADACPGLLGNWRQARVERRDVRRSPVAVTTTTVRTVSSGSCANGQCPVPMKSPMIVPGQPMPGVPMKK